MIFNNKKKYDRKKKKKNKIMQLKKLSRLGFLFVFLSVVVIVKLIIKIKYLNERVRANTFVFHFKGQIWIDERIDTMNEPDG